MSAKCTTYTVLAVHFAVKGVIPQKRKKIIQGRSAEGNAGECRATSTWYIILMMCTNKCNHTDCMKNIS